MAEKQGASQIRRTDLPLVIWRVTSGLGQLLLRGDPALLLAETPCPPFAVSSDGDSILMTRSGCYQSSPMPSEWASGRAVVFNFLMLATSRFVGG